MTIILIISVFLLVSLYVAYTTNRQKLSKPKSPLLLPAPPVSTNNTKSKTDDLVREYYRRFTPIKEAMIQTVQARKYPSRFLNTISVIANVNKKNPIPIRIDNITAFVISMKLSPKIRRLTEFDELTPMELCAVYQYLIMITIIEPVLSEHILKNI